MVAVPAKSSTLSVLKSAVGQYSRPTIMPTPYWQPYRDEFASRILLTVSLVICALAPPMTRIPNSCSAQPPFPGSGPAMVRPLIVTWTPWPQARTRACGANSPSLANCGGSGSGEVGQVDGAEIVAPALPVSAIDLVTSI